MPWFLAMCVGNVPAVSIVVSAKWCPDVPDLYDIWIPLVIFWNFALGTLPLLALVKYCCINWSVMAVEKDLSGVLCNGTIRLLSIEWLLKQPDGFVLARRQDLPPEAFFPAAELRRLVEALGEDWGLLFVVLSYRCACACPPVPASRPAFATRHGCACAVL